MFQTRYRVLNGTFVAPGGSGGKFPCTPVLPLVNCAAAGGAAMNSKGTQSIAIVTTLSCRAWIRITSRDILTSVNLFRVDSGKTLSTTASLCNLDKRRRGNRARSICAGDRQGPRPDNGAGR